jgi:hypothetical protein
MFLFGFWRSYFTIYNYEYGKHGCGNEEESEREKESEVMKLGVGERAVRESWSNHRHGLIIIECAGKN